MQKFELFFKMITRIPLLFTLRVLVADLNNYITILQKDTYCFVWLINIGHMGMKVAMVAEKLYIKCLCIHLFSCNAIMLVLNIT